MEFYNICQGRDNELDKQNLRRDIYYVGQILPNLLQSLPPPVINNEVPY